MSQVLRRRGRPRKSGAERDEGNRRRALIEAAGRLFRAQGFAATSTRDIAAAVGMRSGSPFYHFPSKEALLGEVMAQGMVRALQRQRQAQLRLAATGATEADRGDRRSEGASKCATECTLAHPPDARQRLRTLLRCHFDVIHGPDSDFIPVMLYEWRFVPPAQAHRISHLRRQYESSFLPVLHALKCEGRLTGDVRLARLFLLGALNWSVQWFDPHGPFGLDDLTDEVLGLVVG